MPRANLVLMGVFALTLPVMTSAQFGLHIGKSSSSAKDDIPPNKDAQAVPQQKSKSLLHSAVSQAVDGVNAVGKRVGRFKPVARFLSTITEAIASQLHPNEQKQAADATTLVVERGDVGKTQAWRSDTRPHVTGTSTLTKRLASADGNSCMFVTDVVIVNGMETRADKKMCRKSGASGYVLAA